MGQKYQEFAEKFGKSLFGPPTPSNRPVDQDRLVVHTNVPGRTHSHRRLIHRDVELACRHCDPVSVIRKRLQPNNSRSRPSTPGDGTPGSINITLDKGQWFTLPLWTLLGTSYSNGTPPDPFAPVSIFQTLDITFSIDGIPLIDHKNKMAYFSKFSFHPEISFDSSPISAVIWFEGIGVLHGPLRPGTHVLKLDAKNTEPAFGAFAEFHNTWTLTV